MRSRDNTGLDRPTHAGGVVYWPKQDAVLYLLVRPTSGKDQWVLPKGHIQNGEDDGHAALSEVREETGITARLICPVQSVEFKTSRENVRARFFLVERVSQGESSESRQIGWFPYRVALDALTHPESREVLQAAERKRLISLSDRSVGPTRSTPRER
jgi:8-oxo-dGTP pyrophosphatase MutT (NUDIX family)